MAEEALWPDRGPEIYGSTLSICILSAAILIWRIAYGVHSQRKLLVCDYLLIIATCLNVTSTGVRIKTVVHGQGRHIGDPSISKPHDILQYSYYLWIGQNINLIAVSILKVSICTYLLALPFGLMYKLSIYFSLALVVVFNFTMPTIANFACKPFEANWNKSIEGHCFYRNIPAVTYMQGVSNILTDIVYIVAPILYLSTVKLPPRTQWGLRIVFCLGLIATICSIFKTIELKSLQKTQDPTWDGVNLTIWAATELSVGILVASLPPLRKQFERFLRFLLPSTFQSSKRTPGSHSGIPMYNVTKASRRNTRILGRSDVVVDDGDSERSILEGRDSDKGSDKVDGIMKTVVHEVRSEARSVGEGTNAQGFERGR